MELLGISDHPKSSINKVCEFFTNVGRNLAVNIISHAPCSVDTDMPLTENIPQIPYNTYPCVNSLAFIETDATELDSLILQLRNDCATGWDGISSMILKNSRHILAPPITYLCNLCLRMGKFPDALKKAIVHPIYKGGSRNCVNNYRPISVLPALSKILEKVLNKRLRNYLDKYNLIADNQYGFRIGVSTEDAVLDLTQFVARTLDSKMKCVGIFLDLSKAFDTVSVPILISKLEHLGVRGITLEIFKDYLRNRKQQVKIDTHLSNEQLVTYGVPQGSILGPTLFQIYVNDLCKMSLPNCKIYAYADDTAILVYGPTWEIVQSKAETALNNVMTWLNSNLLTLNLHKTVYIPFAIRRTSSPPPTFSVTAHSCSNPSAPCLCPALTRTDHVKYLGVVIDDGLRWDKQLDTLTTRTMRLIHIFKSLRESANFDTLKMVYYTLCQSIISYCISVWGGAIKTNFLRVERAQRAILKVMTRKPYRYPTTQLYSDCKVLTVRQLFVLQCIFRTHSTTPPSDPKKRRNLPTGTQHKTTFAQHQFYTLSAYIYKKIHKQLNILDLNRHKLKSKVTEWLLQQDYSSTETLLTYIA